MRHSCKRPVLAALMLVLVLAGSGRAAPVQKGRVVVIIMDRITVSDLTGPDLPNLAWCAAHGSVALMNTKTGGALSVENAYITLGAGSRGVGTVSAGAAYAAEEPLENGTAAQVLWRHTGFRARRGNLVVPDLAAITALNAAQDHYVQPGLLGEAVSRAGMAVCALGNADLPDLPGRQVVSFVMNSAGVVERGMVDRSLLQADPEWPFGLRTNYRALLRAYDRLAPGAALVAIDTGDTSRVDALSPLLSPERQSVLRRMAVSAVDRFLGELRRRLDLQHDLLLILSPSPSALVVEEGSPLTPVVVVGPGFTRGWATSATTRRPGIVTNMDVAPTILGFLGIEIPAQTAGRPLQSLPGPGGFQALADLDARLTVNARWHQPAMKFLTILLDVVFVICAVWLIWPDLPGARWLQGSLLLALSLPLAFLIGPIRQDTTYFLPWLIALTVSIAGLLIVLSRRLLLPLLVVQAATAILISLDQLRGASLAKYSLLSYSPITGARFYGVGNEYMGVLIGAAIMSVGLLYTRWHKERWCAPLTLASLILFAIVLGLPGLGTNVGGFLSAAVGFSAVWLLVSGRRLPWRTLMAVAAAGFVLLMIVGMLDSMRPMAVQTHLGRLVSEVRASGLSPFFQVVQRKLATNIKLVRFSGWSRVVALALLAMGLTALRPAGRSRNLAARYPYLAQAVKACLPGAAAAFLFNDSGIVAAGTLLLYPVATWLYLLVDQAAGERSRRGGSRSAPA